MRCISQSLLYPDSSAETITKLLRNMEFISYGQTAGKVFDNLDDCERKFNQVGAGCDWAAQTPSVEPWND